MGIGLIWCQHWADCVLSLWVNGPGSMGSLTGKSSTDLKSFTGPLRAIWQASGLNHRNVSKYIFSNGSTTVLLTHLTALPLTSVNSQLFNNGMYKAQARSGYFAKKRALAGCGELISTHGTHFLGGLTTVVDSGRVVNRLSERWMLKATSCGRNWFVRVIYRSSVNSPHRGHWRGGLMFPLIYAWINGWVNKSWGWWFETPSRSSWRHWNGQSKKQRYISVLHDTQSNKWSIPFTTKRLSTIVKFSISSVISLFKNSQREPWTVHLPAHISSDHLGTIPAICKHNTAS